jgi:hypothetical protein
MPPTSDVTVPVPDPVFVTASVWVTTNVAVTFRAAFIVMVHVPVPEQSPDQPVKAEPEEATAVSVTSVPSAKLALHVAPQLMPATSEVTIPVPDPALVTVSRWVGGPKSAVTSRAWLIVTTQVVLVPEQSPDHPLKAEPPEAVAVSVTSVPSAYVALQVTPQLMPPTFEVTVPVPDPVVPTSSVYDAVPLNVAVTERTWSMVTTHVAALPEQAPDQLTRVCPDAGVAVSVTRVPAL